MTSTGPFVLRPQHPQYSQCSSPSRAHCVVTLLVFIIVNFLDETLICCPSKQRQNRTAKTLPNSCSPSPFLSSLPPLSALVNSRPSRKSVRVSYVGFIKIFSFILFASDANSAAALYGYLKCTLVYIWVYVYEMCVFRIFRYACDIFSLILFSSRRRRRHLKCFLWMLWRFMSSVSCA